MHCGVQDRLVQASHLVSTGHVTVTRVPSVRVGYSCKWKRHKHLNVYLKVTGTCLWCATNLPLWLLQKPILRVPTSTSDRM